MFDFILHPLEHFICWRKPEPSFAVVGVKGIALIDFMMNHSTRREFLKTVGGLGLALGAHPMLGLEPSGPRSAFGQDRLRPAASIGLVPEFKVRDFQQPEAALWPAYFWLWNAPLDSGRLRAQLEDMAAHDARSVCLLPMPRAFRPDSTNNSLDRTT